MIISNFLLFGLVVIAFILVCLTQGPGRKDTGNRWGYSQQMSQTGRTPYGAPTMRRSPSFLTNVVWLIILVGIAGAVLEIRAPGVLHMLLHLWGLS